MVVRVRTRRKTHKKIPVKITGPATVKVGFPNSEVEGSIIDIAIWNHYGTSRGIPSRPFLLNAIRANQTKYKNALKTSAAKILKGDTTTRIVLSKLGILAQGHVQAEIVSLRTPANAQSTIDRKGSSNPLIDEGTMKNSVTWKVDE